MPQTNIPSWAQSSTGDGSLSLTIESVGKVIIGIVAYFLVSKTGLNPADATNQLQAILDLIAQGVPLVFSLWHTCTAIWGLCRKLIPRVSPKPPVPPAPQA